MSETRKTSEKTGGGGRSFLSFLLVLIMLAELVVAAFKYPGFLVKGPEDPHADIRETDGTVWPTASFSENEYERDPEDPFYADDDLSIDEIYEELKVYKTGEAGVDYATGDGPGSDGYQKMDGIGLETRLVYTEDALTAAPSETAAVKAEEETVKFQNTELQLYLVPGEPGTVTLASLPKLTDQENGFDLSGWQLDLPDESLIYPAALTVPLPDLQGQDPYCTLVAQQYDPAIRRWTYIAYTIHEEAQNVTLYVEKSGTVGLFSFLPEGKKTVSISDLFGITAHAADEKPDLDAYESQNLKFGVLPAQLLKKNEAIDPQLAKQIESNYQHVTDRAKTFSDSVELYKKDQAFGLLLSKAEETYHMNSDEAGLAALGVSFYEYAKSLPPTSVGAALTSIGLVYTHINAMRAWNEAQSWKDIAWAIFYYGPEYAAAFISLFASTTVAPELMLLMGVTLLFRSVAYPALQEQKEVPKTTPMDILYIDDGWENLYWDKNKNKVVYKTDYIYNVIQRTLEKDPSKLAYLEDKNNIEIFGFDYAEFKEMHESRSSDQDLVHLNSFKFANRGGSAGWRLMLDYIRKTYADHPDQWVDIFMGYLQECSDQAYAYASDAFFAYHFEGAEGYSQYDHTFNIDEELMKNWVLSNFDQKLMQEFEQACLAQAEKNSAARLGAYSAMVDRKVTFKLTDQSGKAITFNDLGEYKGKYIIFDTTPIGYTLTEPWRASMNSQTILKCTYNGYLLANHPTKLLVYESEADYKKKKDPIARIKIPLLQSGKNEVTIRLGPETMDGYCLVQNYSYHWEGRYSHSMAGYNAALAYIVWSEDRKKFTLSGPYQGDIELVFELQSDGTYKYAWRYDGTSGYYEARTIIVSLIDGFDRMEGTVHDENKGSTNGEDKDKHGYTGFYAVTQRDGKFYINTTGEEISVTMYGETEAVKWELDLSDEIRYSQIGKMFMSGVEDCASQNGYSMKEY